MTFPDTGGTRESPPRIHELLLQGNNSGSSMTGPCTHSRAAERWSLNLWNRQCAVTNVFKAKADSRLRGLCQIDSRPSRVGKRRRARDFVHFFKALPVRELYFFHQAFKLGHHVTERTPSCLFTSEWVYEASLFQILNRPGIIFRGGNSRVTHVLQKQRETNNPQLQLAFIVASWQQKGGQRDTWKPGVL